MNIVERRVVITLSSVLGLRMLGLFLILPVLTLYVNDIPQATPLKIGLALGIYGLAQAILQIPFGYLSDRFGRKPLLVIGLLLFALGSIVAAQAQSIEYIILGRVLQGSGAIASVALAFLADVTREEDRTKAVAIIVISIGSSFLFALMFGPVVDSFVGLSGIFWSASFLAVLAIPVVIWFLPEAKITSGKIGLQLTRRHFIESIFERRLLVMDLGIFVLHMMLTAFFVVVPFCLLDAFNLSSGEHWKIYAPVLVAAVLGMAPLLRVSMKPKRAFPMVRVGAAILFFAPAALSFDPTSVNILLIGLWLFFVGFTLLEALMPSLVSQLAPAAAKGTSIGVYNTFQFMGIFVGGILGGWLFGIFGVIGVFIFCTATGFFLLALVITVQAPMLLENRTIDLTSIKKGNRSALLEQCRKLPGVQQVVFLPSENMAYLKIDPEHFQEDSLEDLAGL